MSKKKTNPIRVTGGKLEMRSIKSIKPYARNARIHGLEQIEQIRASLREFGFVSPVLIDSEGNLIAGHGRVEAAKLEGMSEVPCVIADGLTDAQRRAYILADNRLAETSTWDEALLKIELGELGEIGLDFDAIGFGLGDIGGAELDAETEAEPEAQEDDYDGSVPETTKVKRGDVYTLGRHRLMCGSSAEKIDFEKLMHGEKADMVFTDPPYGVAIGDKNKALNAVQKAGRCTENIEGDALDEGALRAMLLEAFVNVRENCAEDAVYYVTSPQGGSLGLMMMMMMMMDAGLPVRHVLMWKKNCATFSIGRLDYDYSHEPIFYTWTKKHHNFRGGECRTTVWEYDKPRKCDLHPTMKPVGLVANAILDGTQKDMIVLDAFGGSGTTMIAAEQLGRRCYMMELDPKYCQVIIDRWEALTGEKAVLADE